MSTELPSFKVGHSRHFKSSLEQKLITKINGGSYDLFPNNIGNGLAYYVAAVLLLLRRLPSAACRSHPCSPFPRMTSAAASLRVQPGEFLHKKGRPVKVSLAKTPRTPQESELLGNSICRNKL